MSLAAPHGPVPARLVFNGIVDAIDPSTGRAIEPCLITLRATHEQFAPLVLGQVDPVACVRKYFAADVSPHPEELQAVPPVMEFKMAGPRIIDPIDVISQIDKRPNLLELTPKEFEHFVHNLFDRMGFDTKIFKADGDGGVDCVAYDPTPIRGGKYVIQAKLYNKTVPPTAVRDLYGTMQHEGAQSGILITTSGFGPSSYEFANGKPLAAHRRPRPTRVVPRVQHPSTDRPRRQEVTATRSATSMRGRCGRWTVDNEATAESMTPSRERAAMTVPTGSSAGSCRCPSPGQLLGPRWW